MSGSSFGSGEGPGLVPCYSKRVLWWGLLFLPVSQHQSRVSDPEPSPLLVPCFPGCVLRQYLCQILWSASSSKILWSASQAEALHQPEPWHQCSKESQPRDGSHLKLIWSLETGTGELRKCYPSGNGEKIGIFNPRHNASTCQCTKENKICWQGCSSKCLTRSSPLSLESPVKNKAVMDLKVWEYLHSGTGL